MVQASYDYFINNFWYSRSGSGAQSFFRTRVPTSAYLGYYRNPSSYLLRSAQNGQENSVHDNDLFLALIMSSPLILFIQKSPNQQPKPWSDFHCLGYASFSGRAYSPSGSALAGSVPCLSPYNSAGQPSLKITFHREFLLISQFDAYNRKHLRPNLLGRSLSLHFYCEDSVVPSELPLQFLLNFS